MKKIINTPETVVYDMCHGLAKAHPELEFVEKYKIVKKKEIDENKVSLISGGGSGHEPAHAGFVGKGMLDCAVSRCTTPSRSAPRIRACCSSSRTTPATA